MTVQTIIAVLAGLLIVFLIGFAFISWMRFRETQEKAELRTAIAFSVLLVIVIFAEIIYIAQGVTTADVPEGTQASSESMTQTSDSAPVPSSEGPVPTGIDLGVGWYDGEFSDGFCNGDGRMDFYSGDIYSGQWKMGEKDGKGTYYYSRSGDLYCGDWQNDKRTGTGLYVWNATEGLRQELIEDPNHPIDDAYVEGLVESDPRSEEAEPRSLFYGTFSEGHMVKGDYYLWKGIIPSFDSEGNLISVYQRRGHYHGTFKNGLFEGESDCYYIYDNEDRFDGSFKAGMIKNGTFTFADGTMYDVIDGNIEINNNRPS